VRRFKGSADFGGKKDILKSKWEVKASELLIYLFFQEMEIRGLKLKE
jgi:hypothetical protein